jgi:7-cyano-7-deazaguanine reductase
MALEVKNNEEKKYDVFRFSMEDLEEQNPFNDLPVIKNETAGTFHTTMTTSEFSSYCPWTGHPDYATLTISYPIPPLGVAVEQKALRDWLNKFRTIDLYQEEITFGVKWMIHKVCGLPLQEIYVEVDWKGRGGISNLVKV